MTIRYNDGAGGFFYATYMHLASSGVLTSSTAVKLGQTIGYVGYTGAETGPHIHVTYGKVIDSLYTPAGFQIANGSTTVNPGPLVFFTAMLVKPANNVEAMNGILNQGDVLKSDNINTSVEVPATVRAFNVAIGVNQVSGMNGWFFASDQNPGDTISYWIIFDANTNLNSGHFVAPGGWIAQSGQWVAWSGGQVPKGTQVLVTTDELNRSQFVGGKVAGIQNQIYVSAWDGHQFSNWQSFTATTVSGSVF